MSSLQRPTRIRYWVLFATMLVATNMYLDRACLSQVSDLIRADLKLEDWQMDWALGAFFWSYALAQVPAGALGNRFGYRTMLTIYLVVWSVFTATVGIAWGFLSLLAARLLVGLAEAGAYPNAASIVRGWFPLTVRGRANSTVAFGGRLGWALAQILTPVAVGWFAAMGYSGWRGAMVCFGAVGIFAAALFYWLVRDTPGQHALTNQQEREYIGHSPPPTASVEVPISAFLASRNMYLFGLVQFANNVGWAFLITKLPVYLTERFQVPPGSERGFMASLPAWLSCIGMLLGGVLTDYLVKRLGLRAGRAIPIVVTMTICASMYFAGTLFDDPWLVVGLLAVMAMSVDLSNPSIWSFAQDIGGRHVGPTLGWGNMWGNIGAGLSPIVLGWMQREHGWNAVFYTGASLFLVAAVAACFLDATKPILPLDDHRTASRNA